MVRFTKAQKEALDIAEVCAFCENAVFLSGREDMLCRFHGAVDAGYQCRRFRYDLLKRKPSRPKNGEDGGLATVLPTLDDMD